MKSKLILGLVMVAMIASFATTSFAQLSVSGSNTKKSDAEIATNLNANTSDSGTKDNGILISGALIAPSSVSLTVLRLTFPAPVTSSGVTADPPGPPGPLTNIPAADPIQIVGATGAFAGMFISSIGYAAGTVDLVIPEMAGVAAGGSARLIGVRINANGKTGAQNATLNYAPGFSGSGNIQIPGAPVTIELISALTAGLAASIGAPAGTASVGTGLIFTSQVGGAIAKPTASLLVTEGAASLWKSAAQARISSAGAVLNGHRLRVTLANVPIGITVSLTPVFATVSSTALGAGTQAFTGIVDVSGGELFWEFTGSDLDTVETVGFAVTFAGTPSGPLFVAGTNITAAVSMAPVATTPFTNGIPGAASYPRFIAANSTVTILSIAAGTTQLLIPYFAKGFGIYDFGIAVANTTADPFGSVGGAIPSDGAITFTFFITGVAAPISVSTTTLTSTQASGITAGKIKAGDTFTGSVSQMLPSSAPANALGYIFINAEFLDAHGIGYLIETSPAYHITSAVPAGVLPNPTAFPLARRGGVGGAPESLGF